MKKRIKEKRKKEERTLSVDCKSQMNLIKLLKKQPKGDRQRFFEGVKQAKSERKVGGSRKERIKSTALWVRELGG